MRRNDELTNPESCLNKAEPLEMVFVLLARDKAAPAAIEAWINKRLELGLNKPGDKQISDARSCIEVFENEGELIRCQRDLVKALEYRVRVLTEQNAELGNKLLRLQGEKRQS